MEPPGPTFGRPDDKLRVIRERPFLALRERLSKIYDPPRSGYRRLRSGRNCDMRRHLIIGVALAHVAAGCLGGLVRTAVAQDQKSGTALPIFEVDSHFPTMPDHMLLGGVGGATADSHGNVWVFHRPHTLEEGNATENGYVPAPPVLQFSPTGTYIQGWGGPTRDARYEWFNRGGLFAAFAEWPSCTRSE